MNQDQLKALVAELAKHIKSEKDLGSVTQQLVKLTVETALNAELVEHLGYDKHYPAGRRNGTTYKRLNVTTVRRRFHLPGCSDFPGQL